MNTPVSFEIAKLLNKKKCYILSNDRYNKKGTFTYSKAWSISAPTITEVIMWIYEKHNIWVNVTLSRNYNKFTFLLQSSLFEGDKFLHEYYNTPTEAYLAGIEYVLTDLINFK